MLYFKINGVMQCVCMINFYSSFRLLLTDFSHLYIAILNFYLYYFRLLPSCHFSNGSSLERRWHTILVFKGTTFSISFSSVFWTCTLHNLHILLELLESSKWLFIRRAFFSVFFVISFLMIALLLFLP
jgi:hypothetical protein